MAVMVIPMIDGVPQVGHNWPAVPSVGDFLVLGHGTPTSRLVRVTHPPVWYTDTRGECRVELKCKVQTKDG